jgi:acetyltransferase-like isoleucine patch superfamily enzyme
MRRLKYMMQCVFAFIYDFLERQSKFKKYKKLINENNLIIGEYTYGIPEVMIFKGSEAKATIGKFCSIGPDVVFITGGNHPTDWVSTYPFRAELGLEGAFIDGMPSTKGDIIIGNDVWIGSRVTVMSGVKVGDGAVICAGSVVTSDVAPYAIAGGVPAKALKKRFEDADIEMLLKIKWWDWEKDEIIKSIDYLSSPNMDGFINWYKGRDNKNKGCK